MKSRHRHGRSLAPVAATLLLAACSVTEPSPVPQPPTPDPPDVSGGTETNVMAVACETDADCLDGSGCTHADGQESPGVCGAPADPGGTSLRAPAHCATDADCPEGSACRFLDGPESPGFCDVAEHVVEGDETVR